MHPASPTSTTVSDTTNTEPLNPQPTEQTPLLSSTSSATLQNGSVSSQRHDSDADSITPNHRIGPWRGAAVGVSLWLLIFLQASNMSGMTMIQGKLAEDLDAYEAAMWFTSAYLIPMSSLAPVTGRLATIFPARNLVLPVAAFIATGSLVCSRATTFGAFIAGRVIAGVGGAGVLTLAVIVVLELTSKKTRGVYVGMVNACFTFGVSFGAVVFGALLPIIGWRPLFWCQAPFAVLAGSGIFLSMPAIDSGHTPKGMSVKQRLARIDYLGATLMTLTLVLFLYGLSGNIQATPIILSFFSLVLFIIVEYRIAADPVIPLKVLSSRGVLLSCIAQLGMMSARWSVLFYAPVFMLAVQGAAPAVAGSILIPTNLGFGLGGIILGWLHIRRNGAFWLPSIVSVGLFGSTLFALSIVGTPTPSVIVFVVVVFINGFATGAGLNYTMAHLLHLSYEGTQYVTVSLLATFRGFGGSFGTAIGGGIFYRLLRSRLTTEFLKLDGGDHLSPERQNLVSRLLGTPGLVHGGNLTLPEQEIAVDGYAAASRGVWQAAAVFCIAVLAIQAATGWTAPEKEHEAYDEEEARALVSEQEGVGEA